MKSYALILIVSTYMFLTNCVSYDNSSAKVSSNIITKKQGCEIEYYICDLKTHFPIKGAYINIEGGFLLETDSTGKVNFNFDCDKSFNALIEAGNYNKVQCKISSVKKIDTIYLKRIIKDTVISSGWSR